jgi:peptidylprolyl isomerase
LSKSRKRKTRRSGGSYRSTHSSKQQSNRRTQTIAVVAIAALAVAGVLFAGLFLLRGGGGTSGGEVTTASGLKYIDEVVGSGASPKTGQNVTVNYTGTLENGTKFDSSFDRGKPFTFRIGRDPVIQGWEEGLMSMKVGGKRRLIVPPQLGYGSEGRPGIPPDATLIFEVELLGVQ